MVNPVNEIPKRNSTVWHIGLDMTINKKWVEGNSEEEIYLRTIPNPKKFNNGSHSLPITLLGERIFTNYKEALKKVKQIRRTR